MTTINTIEELIRLLDEKPEWLEAVRARILTRELLDLPQTLADFAEATDRRFEAVHRQMDGMRQEMNDGFRSIRTDLGILKAAHARNSAIRQATAITDSLGLNRVRNLEYDDLREISLSSDISEIPSNQILSFRQADLVMEATSETGEPCFVAVEISYTADDRDTGRAMRNANFLTRFTGRTAHAVVAGIDRDNRISGVIDSGEVFWHQLLLSDLETA